MTDDNYFFFFETNKFDKENYRSYYFIDPLKVLYLNHPESTTDFFIELAELTKKYYLAGFFSYELGYFLEPALKNNITNSFPFALFCAYEKPAVFDHNQGKFISGDFRIPFVPGDYNISNLNLTITEEEYKKNIQIIREYISKGDIYQANYTIKFKFDFSGSPFGLYRDLKEKQYVAYNVFAKFDDYYILSLTPELFYRKRGNKIIVKPMKGTWCRGKNILEDERNRTLLVNDEKNRSENVMIVDLLRNDIGKVSIGGSVNVTKLYEIERYNTLFQMTSTVESVLEENVSIYNLIKSIFPSGSITGAPKIRSMEIIKELEKEERNVYTGSIGFFEPSGDSIFNVAIRTFLINNNKGEMGVGGGIVYDSTPDGEFQECKIKANFLIQKARPEFSIIETMLYDKGFEYLDLHIKRMQESAEYFDYIFHEDLLLQRLNELQKSLTETKYKIRILLDRFGYFTITNTKLDTANHNYNIALSENHTESDDIFFYHKTTNRDLYEKEFAQARERNLFDIIFLNEKDELTEGAITNVYVKIKNVIYTPPIECGLLNGIIRQTLLDKGITKEKRIRLHDLKYAETFYISNSIIGFKEAVLLR